MRAALLIALAATSSSCLWFFPYDVENFCETYVRAECRFAFQCCNAHERADPYMSAFVGQYRNEEDCIREATEDLCAFFQISVESARAGRSDFDEERVRTCLEPRIQALNSCDAQAVFDPPETSEECEGVSLQGEGKVADGELCYETFECENDESVCEPLSSDDEEETLITSKGTCKPPPGEGDPCPDFVCAEGLRCSFAQTPPICERQLQDGQPCGSDGECLSGNCEFDDVTFTSTCRPKKPNGEQCTGFSQCQSDFCDFDQNPPVCITEGAGEDDEVTVDACDGLGPDE